MSFLGRLFGKKDEVKGPSTEDALQKLQLADKTLSLKKYFLTFRIEEEVKVAKKNATTNSRGK